MSLAELQEALQQTCLAREPDPEALRQLGAPQFLVYRKMVRRRFYNELKTAFRRTRAAVGDGFFSAAFEHAMVHHPPRTRFFHLFPVEFCANILPFFRDAAQIPPYAVDLLRWEAGRREVANLPGISEDAARRCGEFDFDHPVVLNPAMRLLRLGHPVHQPAKEPQAGYPPKPTCLVLFRPSDADRVRHFRLNVITHDLLLRLHAHPRSMSEAVKSVSEQRKLTVDPDFLDRLCTVLSDFIERGLILGTQRPPG